MSQFVCILSVSRNRTCGRDNLVEKILPNTLDFVYVGPMDYIQNVTGINSSVWNILSPTFTNDTFLETPKPEQIQKGMIMIITKMMTIIQIIIKNKRKDTN